MERHNPVVTGATLAITPAILNSVCVLAVVLWPDQAISFANAWSHGVDFTIIKATTPITLGSFLYGLVRIAGVGFVIGVVYAWVYNLLNRTRRPRSAGVAARHFGSIEPR